MAKENNIGEEFAASAKWSYGFMKRHNLSFRRRTHIAQKLPEDFDEKLMAFQRFIIDQRKKFAYDLSQIGNADQTPLTFDLPQSCTVQLKGSKDVNICTTGNEKNRFTVMLACTADGGKLPPYIVFKRKTLPKGVKWPKGVIVRCQENGWFDEKLTLDWIKSVWAKRPMGSIKRGLLVLDAFRCHKTDVVKRAMREDANTHLAIIPGGMTSILQPLDVSLNKPMKTSLRRKWTEWYADGAHTFTPAGRMRKPELPEICEWIRSSWEEIDPQMIIHSFKKCCISNAIDGTEDDILWTDRHSPAADDGQEEEEEDDDQQDFYAETPATLTDEQFAKLFESEDEDDEFEGF